MNSVTPLVSIGLPVYNGEAYLPRTLATLIGQEYPSIEIIISDNASTDRTEQICREFAAKDSRIRYSKNEKNIGATRNYNRVFELSRGDYFKWASHDDEPHPSLVRRCLEVFDRSPADTVLVFSQADIIDEHGEVLFHSPDEISSSSDRSFHRFGRVLFRSAYAHPLWGVIRSDALRRTRLMGVIEADHVLLGELAMLGKLIEIPETLYRMRRHAKNATEINRSARALLAWHDPSKAKERIWLPHWERTYLEYLRGVRHLSLPLQERILCYGAVPIVSYWRRVLRLTGPARQGLKSVLSGRNEEPGLKGANAEKADA